MLSRDSKRIQGPSSTTPVSAFLKDDRESIKINDQAPALCDKDELRADGRRLDECLPVYLRTGMLYKFSYYSCKHISSVGYHVRLQQYKF